MEKDRKVQAGRRSVRVGAASRKLARGRLDVHRAGERKEVPASEAPLRLDELPDVLTAPEAARVLRIGRNGVYEALRCGAIPSVRIGRRLLVPKAAILRMLEGAEESP